MPFVVNSEQENKGTFETCVNGNIMLIRPFKRRKMVTELGSRKGGGTQWAISFNLVLDIVVKAQLMKHQKAISI